MLEGKKIAIGVTGGIACYKVVTLVSRLVQAGAEVRVVMSEAATKLVSPLLFKEISGAPVAYDMWRGNDEFNVEHVPWAVGVTLWLWHRLRPISLARWLAALPMTFCRRRLWLAISPRSSVRP